MSTELRQALANHNHRVTTPRVQVFECLSGSREPVTLATLAQACPTTDRVSIYRTLELFERLNIITVVHVGWKKRYELSSAYQTHHHHHLICTSCGHIIEINSERLEDVISSLTGTHHFTPTGHTFEITGVCMKCSK